MLNSNSQAHVTSHWLEDVHYLMSHCYLCTDIKLCTLLLWSRVWVHKRLNIKPLWTYKSIVSFKVEILWLEISHQDLNFHHCFLGGILVHVHVSNHTLLFKRQQIKDHVLMDQITFEIFHLSFIDELQEHVVKICFNLYIQ